MSSQAQWKPTSRSTFGSTWRQGAAVALCAVMAFALHGAIVLAEQHAPGLERPNALCHFLAVVFLQPDLSSGTPPTLTVAGWLVEAPIPKASSALLPLLPSRGPPA